MDLSQASSASRRYTGRAPFMSAHDILNDPDWADLPQSPAELRHDALRLVCTSSSMSEGVAATAAAGAGGAVGFLSQLLSGIPPESPSQLPGIPPESPSMPPVSQRSPGSQHLSLPEMSQLLRPDALWPHHHNSSNSMLVEPAAAVEPAAQATAGGLVPPLSPPGLSPPAARRTKENAAAEGAPGQQQQKQQQLPGPGDKDEMLLRQCAAAAATAGNVPMRIPLQALYNYRSPVQTVAAAGVARETSAAATVPVPTPTMPGSRKRHAHWPLQPDPHQFVPSAAGASGQEEGGAPTVHDSSAGAAVNGKSTAVAAGAATMAAGAGAVPLLQVPQGAGTMLPVPVLGQLFLTPQGQVLVPPQAAFASHQLAQVGMAAAGLSQLPMLGANNYLHLSAAAGLAAVPAGNQVASMILQQQQQQQLLQMCHLQQQMIQQQQQLLLSRRQQQQQTDTVAQLPAGALLHHHPVGTAAHLQQQQQADTVAQLPAPAGALQHHHPVGTTAHLQQQEAQQSGANEQEAWRLYDQNPKYEVSDRGNVRSSISAHKKLKPIKPKRTCNQLTVHLVGPATYYKLRNLVAHCWIPGYQLEANGSPPDSPTVIHKNGDFMDCSVGNLQLL